MKHDPAVLAREESRLRPFGRLCPKADDEFSLIRRQREPTINALFPRKFLHSQKSMVYSDNRRF